MSFIGFEEDYKEYKEVKEKETTVGTGNKIASVDMPDISQADLDIITKSRKRHDCFTVYMQSDMSFYDEYYNMEEKPDEFVTEDLMKKVKTIKRIYKNFLSYNAAMKLRDKYIDTLIDKYGGPEMFSLKLRAGAVVDWIPPIPVYSKNSPDYKYYLEGKIGSSDTEWNDDFLIETMKRYTKQFEETHDVDKIEVSVQVLTDPRLIYDLKYVDHDNRPKRPGITLDAKFQENTINGMSPYDTEGMMEVVRSMIAPETTKVPDQTVNQNEFFRLTKDRIEEDFYLTAPISTDDLTPSLKQGYYKEPEEDLNEMMVDPESHKPMTKREYLSRKLIRELSRESGWNELRLMYTFGIGNSYEWKRMKQKEKRRRKARKQAQSFMNSMDILGEDVKTVSTIGELDDIMFSDI